MKEVQSRKLKRADFFREIGRVPSWTSSHLMHHGVKNRYVHGLADRGYVQLFDSCIKNNCMPRYL